MSIRVLLVDDQELIRTGFALILGTADGIEVVGDASDGAEALNRIAALDSEQRSPDVVLMDVRMAGMNGIEATRLIAQRYPHISVIVLTTFDLDEYAIEAVEAGASGFLLKDARAAELVGAVRAVADGDSVMAPSVTQRLMSRLREQRAVHPGSSGDPANADQPQEGAVTLSSATRDRIERLTDREREVFELVAEGLSNVEVGKKLFLSESTVKTHVGRMLAKLELRDRVHAVILAYEAGIR